MMLNSIIYDPIYTIQCRLWNIEGIPGRLNLIVIYTDKKIVVITVNIIILGANNLIQVIITMHKISLYILLSFSIHLFSHLCIEKNILIIIWNIFKIKIHIKKIMGLLTHHRIKIIKITNKIFWYLHIFY